MFLHICSLGGTALLRLPSDARLEVRNAGPGCPVLAAAVLLLHSSGPKLVHLLLANYKRSLLVVSSYFQNKQRSGHKEIIVILSEPEAQGVFYNLGKRFHGGKLRRKVERSPQQAGDEGLGVPFFRSHQKLRKCFF